MRPQAVVFDCDGVLVDSEPHSRAAWLDVLENLGHPATEIDVRACTGLGFTPTREALNRIEPLPASDVLWPLLMTSLRRSFRAGLRRFPDAIELLDAVDAAGIPVAVASASPRERLDLTLRSAGLGGRFPVSIAGDEVASGKPAPDGYLAAVRGLEVDPAGALAIEDSEMGVRAAQAAGMRVVAVVREAEARPSLEATGAQVVDHLAPALLGIR